MRLDCSTLDSALITSSALLHVEAEDLCTALQEAEPGDVDEIEDVVIKALTPDRDLDDGNDAVFFHMSRVRDPECFRRHGIRPRADVIDDLWNEMKALGSKQAAHVDWGALRHWIETSQEPPGPQYQGRMGGKDEGPCGVLLRAPLDRPESCDNDFLWRPETVQDILEGLNQQHGVNLFEAFVAATKPVIVAFSATPPPSGPRMRDLIANALHYVRVEALMDDKVADVLNTTYDGDGKPVPASDVISVEVIEP